MKKIILLAGAITITVACDREYPIGEIVISAARPNISTQPNGRAWHPGESIKLEVEATITDGGTLSYQWFKGESANTSTATKVDGQTTAAISIDNPKQDTNIIGKDGLIVGYYFVEVTNSKPDASGNKVTTNRSSVVEVKVVDFDTINAEKPKFESSPSDADYLVSTATGAAAPRALEAKISVSEPDDLKDGKIVYQWLQLKQESIPQGKTIDSLFDKKHPHRIKAEYDTVTPAPVNSGSVASGGQTKYTPAYNEADTFYYWVVAVNTLKDDIKRYGGRQSDTARSSVAKVVVHNKNAAAPKITKTSTATKFEKGDKVKLVVEAVSTDEGTITYQWYKKNADTFEIVENKSDSAFDQTVTDARIGDKITYKVKITNTNNNLQGYTTAITNVEVTIEITAQTAPKPTISSFSNNNSSVSVTATIPDGKGKLSYKWFVRDNGSASVAVEDADEATLTGEQNKCYSVEVTNTRNCEVEYDKPKEDRKASAATDEICL